MRVLPALAIGVILAACGGQGDIPSVTTTAARSPTPQPTPSVSAAAPPTAMATSPEALEPNALAERIQAADLERHLVALQEIADAHGGHRATGSPGYAASLAYAVGALTDSGYVVERHVFDIGGMAGTNLLVEHRGTGEGVVMLGAHLDSVPAGAGINDNGSGVAAVLAIAEALAGLPPSVATIRLALWDAEEGGRFGSRAHVETLTAEQRADVSAYLNLDMIGSPNGLRLVYAEADAAPGSDAITAAFAARFDAAGLPWEPIDLEGDSDHGPFVAAGIPTGGLFSGGIEPVTETQADRFGATPNVAADACSHRACDTIDNVDLDTLTEMARAAASVLAELAGG